MFSDYLGDKDWQICENANTQKSINEYVILSCDFIKCPKELLLPKAR
ncbi:hypothetical protein JCM17380_51350 [Desulfosporosinus burensis]